MFELKLSGIQNQLITCYRYIRIKILKDISATPHTQISNHLYLIPHQNRTKSDKKIAFTTISHILKNSIYKNKNNTQ